MIASGSSGFVDRFSINKKRANRTRAIPMKVNVEVPVQPSDSALVIPKTRETKPSVAVIAPGMSYFVSPVARLSLTYAKPRNTARIAMGTLTHNVQCHDVYSVKIPPSTRPIAAPAPESAPYTPNAFARSFESVKVTEIKLRAAGARSAAKTPWSPRAANSIPAFTESPPSAEAAANPIRPTINIRLRPWKSAIRPPRRRRPPNAKVYAVTTH